MQHLNPRHLVLALVGAAFAVWTAAPVRAADFGPAQRKEIESIVHDYLLQHPEVLLDAMHAAQDKLDHEAATKTSQLIADHRHQIFDDAATPVGGNPKGNVTLVEFFDYRCPYCKKSQPTVEKLAAEDHNLRVVYKEFPILGPVSTTAAHAALAAERQGKYLAFHKAMMAATGNITDDTVYRVAGSVGLDVDRLKRDMASPAVAQALKANLQLASLLDIRGTPSFIVGDHLIPGAADLDDLKKLIAEAPKE